MSLLPVFINHVFTKFIPGRAICIFLFIKVLFICSTLTARPVMTQPSEAQVVIIDDFHPAFLEHLETGGISYRYSPEVSAIEARSVIKDAEIVAVRSKLFFDKDLIETLPGLKCIARGGAGMDNIDEDYARSRGISLL